jgi:hypothetical protein
MSDNGGHSVKLQLGSRQQFHKTGQGTGLNFTHDDQFLSSLRVFGNKKALLSHGVWDESANTHFVVPPKFRRSF